MMAKKSDPECWLASLSALGSSLPTCSSMVRRLKVAVIVNPAADKGGTAKNWLAIEAELTARLGPFEPRFTTVTGHASALARAEGVRRVMAVSGDHQPFHSQSRWAKKLGGIAHLLMTTPDAVLLQPTSPSTASRTVRGRSAMVADTENGGGGMRSMPGRDVRRWRARPSRDGRHQSTRHAYDRAAKVYGAAISIIPRCG